MTQLSSRDVRTLGPIPTYILTYMIMMKIEGQDQLMEKEISIGAGVSRNKVSDTMVVLETLGYATRINRYKWTLSDGVRQLPLYKMLAADYPQDEKIEVKADVLDLPAAVPSGNRTWCDSNPPSTTTVNPDINQPDIKPLVLGADAHRERVEAACDEFGIGEPARSEFARDKSITPEMVRYHCKAAKSKGQSIGLAVYRLRKHWQIPGAKTGQDVCAQTIQLGLPEVNATLLPDEAVQAWVTARESAIPAVGMAVYRSFVEGAELIGWVEGVYTIRVGNQPSAELIRTRCQAVIEAALGARLEVVV